MSENILDKLPPTDATLSMLLPEYARSFYDFIYEQIANLNDEPFDVDVSSIFPAECTDEELLQHGYEVGVNMSRYLPFEPTQAALSYPPVVPLSEIDENTYLWTVRINYRYPLEENIRIQEIITAKVEEIIAGMPRDTDEFEKALYLFRWLASNVELGDSSANLESLNEHADEQNIKGALVDQKAVCGGMAAAMKALCDAAGIYCRIVPATVRVANEEIQNLFNEIREIKPAELKAYEKRTRQGFQDDIPVHSICLIVAGGKPFYCDVMIAANFHKIEQKHGHSNTPYYMGFGMGTSMLHCHNICPQFPDVLTSEMLENEYTDITRYDLYYHCRKYDWNAIRSFIVEHIKKDCAAFIAFDNDDDKELFFKDTDALDSLQSIADDTKSKRAVRVFEIGASNVCIVKPVD